MNLTDAAVLEYLRKKGLGSAALELQQRLEAELPKQPEKSTRDRLEDEDTVNRNQRSLLTKSTGGSYGYDRDAAWPVVQWGIPDTSSSSLASTTSTMGADEARAYLDAFVSFQLWVLSLPDDLHDAAAAADGTGSILVRTGSSVARNPIQRAHALLKDGSKEVSLSMVMSELAKPPEYADPNSSSSEDSSVLFNLPPSVRNEMLSVSFALLVHTYCELLEVGCESSGHCIRDAFKPIYEPLYAEEYRDLYNCTSTEDMMRLNSHNSQHMEALANLKTILVQVASFQYRREEYKAQNTVNGETLDAQQIQAKEQKVAEYDRHIGQLKNKYNELSLKATAAFDKMQDLPFLRRARAVRWQLTVSTSTYAMLSSFLNAQHDNSLLAMSSLLQTKCELHVERRDPLPFTPTCVLDGIATKKRLDLNNVEINWAAPMPRWREEKDLKLPFPKFAIQEEYDTQEDANLEKKVVEFNRALLINGFRRLEALERKREYDVLPQPQKRMKEADWQVKRAADPLKPSILMTTLCANSTNNAIVRPKPASSSYRATASFNGPNNSNGSTNIPSVDVSSIWEEAGIGLVCAKLCEPDGRRVAVGCDDSAVRIWSATGAPSKSGEPLQVLLGHKNGFPVFGVDWNRDGRTLLSSGGDGSVRLWDTMAVGPFGELPSPSAGKLAAEKQSIDDSEELVPGLRAESDKFTNGAALAVYRGHAPSTPVWSVSFAPSGYYFASAGADATARLWTTDRPVPVRLFTGHTSWNVNCVAWHPNCNYIMTGSDDRTSRLWDIQSGRTVRLLTGFTAGVNAVQIDPSGRYAAAADYSGAVQLWDLGSGKRITTFRYKHPDSNTRQSQSTINKTTIHALRFSSCGEALATGGDACCVRVWDVRRDTMNHSKPMTGSPVHSFSTRQTMILDLFYTKRNLLLAAGKYMTPVPVVPLFD
jgi:WD40 repeat protein